MFLKKSTYKSTGTCCDEKTLQQDYSQNHSSDKIGWLKSEIETADAIVIGAGAGLSASAGMSYSGERFEKTFSDFHQKYGITDMYSGGFYPFNSLEEYWAWWSRHIYVNRYGVDVGEPYTNLLDLVKDKNYFVLTTNVDHQFQLAGFDKKRMFYTQGDYGLWQCSRPCHDRTYDNEEQVREMLMAAGFLVEKAEKDGKAEKDNRAEQDGRVEKNSKAEKDGRTEKNNKVEKDDRVKKAGRYEINFANKVNWKMEIPSELIPCCPICGAPMVMNLRCDNTFVEDEGWRSAAERYTEFIRRYGNKHILFLELGVGANTPVIIKYPFWRMTARNPKAVYACLNKGEAIRPAEIGNRSICMDDDIGKVLEQLIYN